MEPNQTQQGGAPAAVATPAQAPVTKSLEEMAVEIAKNPELMKSIESMITKAIDNSTGFSTRQSLSQQVTDFSKRVTPLFDMLPREQVFNPVHQWDAIVSGASGIASYAGPIDSVGSDSDPIIIRYSEAVKYYRTTTTVGQFTNAMSRPELPAQQTVDTKAIDNIKKDIEKDIWGGATGGNNIHGIFSAINTYAPAANQSAINGALSATTHFDTVERVIVEAGGLATHIFFNPTDKQAFRNIFSTMGSYPNPQNNKTFGYTVEKYMSTFGEVDLMWDSFIPAKTGSPAESKAAVLDLSTWALGEPTVNGASGIAMQDLAKTGPKTVKLVNYYGLLMYRSPYHNGLVTDIQ